MTNWLTAAEHTLRNRLALDSAMKLRDEIAQQARAAWERELAEVRRQAAWDALGEYCESEHSDEETSCRFEKVTCSVRRFRDTHYAPTPRSVTLSDGSVVRYEREMFLRKKSGKDMAWGVFWVGLVEAHDTGADFDALKAFAATVEGR